jgi:Mn-dependent DtxR family transcriptional regulator
MNLRNFRNEARDDYLEAILLITQEKGHCRSIHIAETLDVTKPSVSVAVGKLIEAGLITMNDDKTIRFTEHGRALAELTLAKHQFLKDLLRNAGVDDETAELCIEATLGRAHGERLAEERSVHVVRLEDGAFLPPAEALRIRKQHP